MIGKLVTWAVLGVAGVVLACGGLLGALFFGDSDPAGCALPSTTTAASDGGTVPAITVAASAGVLPAVGRWNSTQVGNAAAIVAAGIDLHVPPRGWVIAVATAMQESALDNIPGGTQDAVDLFQQRPSQGWGTPAQLMDPHDAATRFYRKLLTVPGWQVLPLTDAAQAVQQSAYPEAYAQWQPEASTLVTAIASTNGLPADGNLGPCVATCLQALESSNNQTSPGPGCLDGLAVLGRAATWLTAWNGAPVPYLSSADPSTWFDRYRRDCSGYASMALGLPGPGLDTAALAAASTPIPKNALRAGDLLVNPAPGAAGHVVIFDRWTDSSMTSYIGYEQSGDRGTHHRVIPYPYFSNYPMSPYRYGN